MFRPILVTPPAADPVTLAEVKAQCVVDFPDDDDLIAGFISAAVARLDGFRGVLGRAMVTQTWQVSASAWVRSFILPVPDVSAVSIVYDDENGAEQTGPVVTLHPVATGTLVSISSDYAFPALQSDNAAPIRIEFTCGFGDPADVPSTLKLAVKALAAAWYEDRSASKDLPMGVEALIAPYRWTMV